jgi:alkylation response protein AidB-like acyl-CoA dehydrogenase
MYFGLTEEQQQLQESVRDFLEELPGARAVLEGAATEDAEVWARIVEEQGWQAVAISEEDGGFGFGWLELALIFEELGRTLTPCPLLGTALATAALQGASRSEVLGAIAAGAPAALAFDTEVTARREGEGWILRGVAEPVVDGGMAEHLVLETDQGLFLVQSDQVQRESLPALDVTRPLARLHLNEVALPASAQLEGLPVEPIQMIGEVLLAAESVGAADATLELAVEYAKARKQFGAPIGSFQAIQHICADMLLAVESARSATWYAAWAVSTNSSDQRLAARTAKAMASSALRQCAGANIQIHGGIGFTWEHDAHLYFKRAQSSATLLNSPSEHRRAIADALLGAL